LAIGEEPPAYLCAVLDQKPGQQETSAALVMARQLLACWWRELANWERLAADMVLEERKCLRREIHDSVAQTLSYLVLRLRALLVLAAEENLADLEAGLRELLEISDGAYLDLRESLNSLWTPASPEAPLVTLVTAYAREFEERSDIRIRVTTRDSWQENLDQNTRMQLLRIVQEALTNVRKHARAQEVEITMERKADGQLVLRIKDDGCGFDPQSLGSKRQQFGVAGMKERASRVGAKLVINSAHRAGTEVVVYLPPRGRGWCNEQIKYFVS
jgi:signal transduction histidine kinase